MDRTEATPWGLDWFVQAGHGGTGNRNCTLAEDASLATPAYPLVYAADGTTLQGPSQINAERHKANWDLSATYAINPDVSAYARVATGFRAPSIGAPSASGPATIADAETITSYEAGIKADLSDRGIRTADLADQVEGGTLVRETWDIRRERFPFPLLAARSATLPGTGLASGGDGPHDVWALTARVAPDALGELAGKTRGDGHVFHAQAAALHLFDADSGLSLRPPTVEVPAGVTRHSRLACQIFLDEAWPTLTDENADYDALMLQFDKRFSRNYSARVSYTLASSRGNTTGNGAPTSEEMSAAATARSAAGSSTDIPPAMLTKTSSPIRLRPARFSSTARSSDNRF